MKDDKYKDFEVLGGKGHTTSKVIENGLQYIKDLAIKADQKKRANDPYWFEEAFAFCFARAISMMFFHLGFDYWRKECKIIVFIAGVLIPAIIVII